MWRCAQAQRAEQMTEHRLSILRTDAECFEHFLLQLWLMDSHAAAADLHAVEHDVVSFRTDLGKFVPIVHERKVLGFGSGERMMDRIPFIFFRAPLHQRKIRYPEEIPDVRAGVRAGWAVTGRALQIQDFRDAQSNSTQDFAGDLPLVGAE